MLLDSFTLADDGHIPNNPALPVLVYRDVAEVAGGPAACEELFTRHGWGGTWRSGIFPFHHFHSVSHEVLGIVSGTAGVTLGGPQGRRLDVRAGDVLVLPAGTGHCREAASADLLVVGAYPRGQEPGTCAAASLTSTTRCGPTSPESPSRRRIRSRVPTAASAGSGVDVGWRTSVRRRGLPRSRTSSRLDSAAVVPIGWWLPVMSQTAPTT